MLHAIPQKKITQKKKNYVGQPQWRSPLRQTNVKEKKYVCLPQWRSPLRPSNVKEKKLRLSAAMEISIATVKRKRKIISVLSAAMEIPITTDKTEKEKYILLFVDRNGDPHCEQQTEKKKKCFFSAPH